MENCHIFTTFIPKIAATSPKWGKKKQEQSRTFLEYECSKPIFGAYFCVFFSGIDPIFIGEHFLGSNFRGGGKLGSGGGGGGGGNAPLPPLCTFLVRDKNRGGVEIIRFLWGKRNEECDLGIISYKVAYTPVYSGCSIVIWIDTIDR